MKLNIKKAKKNHHGKKYFIFSFSCLVALAGSTVFFSAPEVKSCKKETQTVSECACPVDSKYIGHKNIILIDASDPVPKPKIKDIEELTQQYLQSEKGMISWAVDGKKVDKTSIYILNNTAPVNMEPIASFCQLPPENSFDYFSSLTGQQIKAMKDSLIEAVEIAGKDIANYTSSNSSEVIKAVATVTSNSATWKNGSTFILVSDLYENSSTCGWFDKNPVPEFKSIPTACQHQIDAISQYLSEQNTTVAICTIHSKDMKAGLKDFWDEIFYSANGRKPIYTCDQAEIATRSKFIGNN